MTRSLPRDVFKEIKEEAFKDCTYEIDRSVTYEEEHKASDALLVPAFVHGTASLKPQANAHEFLWRWEPGARRCVEVVSRLLVAPLEHGVSDQVASL